MAAILSRAFSCSPPWPMRWASVIRKSREGFSSGSMSRMTLPAGETRCIAISQAWWYSIFFTDTRSYSRSANCSAVSSSACSSRFSLPELRQHLRVVAAPVLQNQAAEAVVVWHAIPRMDAPVLTQPARVYL